MKQQKKNGSPREETAAAARVLAEAARVVALVREGRSADDALLQADQALSRSAIRAVSLGTLRWLLRFEPAVMPLLARPAAQTPLLLRALLNVAVHQIEQSRNPRESTVSAAVDAARLLNLAHAAGLINAVLRRYLRERETLLAAVDADVAAAAAHPAWLVEMLKRSWPDDVPAILAANNEHPPLTLRVDLTRIGVDDYLGQLQGAGLAARAVTWLPTAVTLEQAVPVSRLPGFNEGLVSIQDASAQLAARLLEAQPGQRVLDACAAPGGKTGAILELVPGVDLLAIDVDGGRLQRVADNLRRLQRNAPLQVADLAGDLAWWDGRRFDRILLDAPCSGTGVIRRHPDIRLLRRPDDIAALALTQSAILRNCWRMLAPGGRLLYVTCSLLKQENDAVIAAFLAGTADAAVHRPAALPSALASLRECPVGWQMLPGGEAGGDGFYYACLTRA